MGFYKTGLLPGGAWGHREGEGSLNLGLRQEEDSSKEEAVPAPPSGPHPSLRGLLPIPGHPGPLRASLVQGQEQRSCILALPLTASPRALFSLSRTYWPFLDQ